MLRVLTLLLVLALRAPAAIAQETAATRETADRVLQDAQRLERDDAFRRQLDAQRRAITGLSGAGTRPSMPLVTTAPGRRQPLPSLGDPRRAWSETNRQPLLILVSFSMPDADLRQLAAQAARIGGVLVLRGLVDGSFPATQARLAAFGDVPGAAFQVDPTVFRRFGVEAVPTFILPLETLQACTTTGCPVPAHVRLRGDAGVDHVLQVIARDAKDAAAREVARRMLALLEEAP